MKRMLLRKSPPKTTPVDGEPAWPQDVPALACPQTGQIDSPNDPTTLFTTTRERGIGYVDNYLQALSANLQKQDFEALAVLWDGLADLPYHVGVVATADFALRHMDAKAPIPESPEDRGVAHYLIHSWFLTKCHSYLTADSRGYERLHLVSGMGLAPNRYTLDHMERVAMSHQSIGGARLDQNGLRQALMTMDTFDAHVHGLFHSHPGSGADATHPSQIDFATHKRYEDGGYPLIGAIFVPGFVRFFSANKAFRVTIHGRGVEQVPGETNVYKIQNTQARCVVSYETPQTQNEGRGDG